MIAVTAIFNGLFLHWSNKQKEDPIKRQAMLAPYYQRVKGVPKSEYAGEEAATTQAWIDLGDKHPDFKYTL